jgi:hypothetical protein
LALALASLGEEAPLPKPIGPINDYGQTLERVHREELSARIEELGAEGISFVYLASWHDPFGDPNAYAREVFRGWGLGPEAALVVFVRQGGRWHVAGHLGAAIGIPRAGWDEILSQAEREANRGRPATAALSVAEDLLRLVTARGSVPPEVGTDGARWPYVLLGILGVGAVGFFVRRRLCPRCFHPLRRRRSVGGTMWVCPHCRFVRASWRRGEG